MRKGRLFQEICHLLERGQSTATDMAAEFGVSVRTVYRDVEFLNAAGIPVYAETGRSGGICLMKGFVLDRALLSQDERGSILEAIRAREEEFAMPDAETLRKLATLFELPAGDWLDVDLSQYSDAPRAADRFSFLQRSVMQHNCVELTMADPDGDPRKLTVMPLMLCYRTSGWYLKAFCAEGQEYCTLPLSFMIKWKSSLDSFEPRSFPDEPPAPQPKLTRVVVRFSQELAGRVYEAFDATLITQRRDGSLELRQDMPVDERFIGKLLSLGPGAKVSSPQSLKDEIIRRSAEIWKLYN